jgi:hypothetical protein
VLNLLIKACPPRPPHLQRCVHNASGSLEGTPKTPQKILPSPLAALAAFTSNEKCHWEKEEKQRQQLQQTG